jgi:hypothetical protein
MTTDDGEKIADLVFPLLPFFFLSDYDFDSNSHITVLKRSPPVVVPSIQLVVKQSCISHATPFWNGSISLYFTALTLAVMLSAALRGILLETLK